MLSEDSVEDSAKTPRRRWLRRIIRAALLLISIVVVVLTIAIWRIVVMPGWSFRGELPALKPDEVELRDNLRRHVQTLAGDLGPRNFEHMEAYRAGETYIAESLERSGYAVKHLQPFTFNGVTISNPEAEIRGTSHPEQILIVGAHYDSVREGPGANDNISAVAAMLEIARMCAGRSFARTIRFVAFYNEEGLREGPDGSALYAADCRARNENIVGMICLETIGCYTDAPHSQKYPFPFSLFYPSTGNFVAFVGNLASRQFVHENIWAFRQNAQFPSRGVTAPDFIKDVARSDHRWFWREGYPALMVTDTADFRYRYYHTLQDTPDKLEYDRLARVTAGLGRVVQDLANKAN